MIVRRWYESHSRITNCRVRHCFKVAVLIDADAYLPYAERENQIIFEIIRTDFFTHIFIHQVRALKVLFSLSKLCERVTKFRP